jgi:hypothetical protein
MPTKPHFTDLSLPQTQKTLLKKLKQLPNLPANMKSHTSYIAGKKRKYLTIKSAKMFTMSVRSRPWGKNPEHIQLRLMRQVDFATQRWARYAARDQ